MARIRKPRTFTLDDATFSALKSIVLARQMAGRRDTVSSIVEHLIKGFIAEHSDELEIARSVQDFQRQFSPQIDLFDDGDGSNAAK